MREKKGEDFNNRKLKVNAMEIKIRVPPNVNEEVARRIAEIVIGRINELKWVNELLKRE